MADTTAASAAGTVSIGDDLTVNRLGYGAMQLTGPGVWGEPADRDEAIRVLRRAVELGVDFIDTADSYGPEVSEELIAEALAPYPDGLVIATKGGLLRDGPGRWRPDGRPEHLRAALEGSLARLGVEQVTLYQFHRPDRKVPFEESVGELVSLRDEGKIAHIGLSNVTVAEIRRALELTPIASVQNLYNLANRAAEDVLAYCADEGIAFIPWFPLATGELAGPGSPVARIAAEKGVTPSQLALAWLLHQSPVILPIPGTSSVAHLEENTAAAGFSLRDDEMRALTEVAG